MADTRSDPEEGDRVHTWVVVEDETERLDQYVARRLGLSRSRVQGLIASGDVTVDGRTPRKSHQVSPGEGVSIRVPAPEPLDLVPEDLPIERVFEDEHLVVVDKPAGMVVHPSAGHATGTLVHALLHHVRDLSGIGGTLRPGIVHRLDKDTSGLLVVAKTDQAHRGLSDALRERSVSRVYQAASWGRLPESPLTITAPIDRDPRHRKRMGVVPGGRPAVTTVETVERWPAAEMLRVVLGTGRTHQIRVHLLHIGHPIVGDSTYGAGWERGMSGEARRWAADLARRATRQFLHAHELSFRHPVTHQNMRFVSPLPPDLAEIVCWARGEDA